jgi:predicted aminopeptidase
VIHEIAHNTLYVPGSTAFSESFASFVGYRGAEALFESRGDSANAARARNIWRDEQMLSDFYAWLADALERLYESGLSADVLVREKRSVFDLARERLQTSLGDSLQVHRADLLARRTLNNASVVASRLYRTRLTLFETLWEAVDGDLRRAVRELADAIERDRGRDPFDVLSAISSERPH